MRRTSWDVVFGLYSDTVGDLDVVDSPQYSESVSNTFHANISQGFVIEVNENVAGDSIF